MGYARAVWLGKTYDADEHIVSLEDGLITTTRSIKRMAPSKRYDRVLVAEMIGMPWHRFHVGIAKSLRAPAATPAGLATVAEEAQVEGDIAQGSAGTRTDAPKTDGVDVPVPESPVADDVTKVIDFDTAMGEAAPAGAATSGTTHFSISTPVRPTASKRGLEEPAAP